MLTVVGVLAAWQARAGDSVAAEFREFRCSLVLAHAVAQLDVETKSVWRVSCEGSWSEVYVIHVSCCFDFEQSSAASRSVLQFLPISLRAQESATKAMFARLPNIFFLSLSL